MTSITKIKSTARKILKKNHVAKAGLFGSFARNEEREDSDIDILIEFKGGLLHLIRLQRELEKSLGRRVDLLTYNGIHPPLKKRILKEEVRIL